MTLTLLAPLIAVVAVGGVAIVLRAQRGRQARLVGRVVEPGIETRDPGGGPSLLYFTGVACTICHTAQKPALAGLDTVLEGRVPIREVDVADDPQLAQRYRVMSLPTIIVLDAAGQVTNINVGFTSGEKLRGQLVGAGLPHGQPVPAPA
jgi:thiol-disulfide isomerase/thioredoxin